MGCCFFGNVHVVWGWRALFVTFHFSPRQILNARNCPPPIKTMIVFSSAMRQIEALVTENKVASLLSKPPIAVRIICREINKMQGAGNFRGWPNMEVVLMCWALPSASVQTSVCPFEHFFSKVGYFLVINLPVSQVRDASSGTAVNSQDFSWSNPVHPVIWPVTNAGHHSTNHGRPGDPVLSPFAGSMSVLLVKQDIYIWFWPLSIVTSIVDLNVTVLLMHGIGTLGQFAFGALGVVNFPLEAIISFRYLQFLAFLVMFDAWLQVSFSLTVSMVTRW